MSTSFLRIAKFFVASGLIFLLGAAPNRPMAPVKKLPKAQITNYQVGVEKHQVLISFELAYAFDEELRRRLDSGLATGLVYDFHLVRKRRLWFNRTLARGKLQVSAMYNAVSREYLVNFKHDGALIESRLVRDPEELHAAMTVFDEIHALPLDGQKGDLTVRMRAELGTGSLLFFIPTLKTTDWIEEKIEVTNGHLTSNGE